MRLAEVRKVGGGGGGEEEVECLVEVSGGWASNFTRQPVHFFFII